METGIGVGIGLMLVVGLLWPTFNRRRFGQRLSAGLRQCAIATPDQSVRATGEERGRKVVAEVFPVTRRARVEVAFRVPHDDARAKLHGEGSGTLRTRVRRAGIKVWTDSAEVKLDGVKLNGAGADTLLSVISDLAYTTELIERLWNDPDAFKAP